MNHPSAIVVNPKAKKRIQQRHPWVFQSDIVAGQEAQAGVVEIYDPRKEFLGQGLWSPHSQIALRWLTPRREVINVHYWEQKIREALTLREQLQIPSNAYRVIFGESDGIPSFVLDRYGDAVSFQSLSAGLEAVRGDLLTAVRNVLNPHLIVERNDVSVRQLEKLPLTAQVLEGQGSTQVEIFEDGLKFNVDLLEGQKTGAFLDQRNNRLLAGQLAKGQEKILDIFAYQGWFSAHLAKQGAQVTAVDQSAAACRMILENAALNQLSSIEALEVNAFDQLKLWHEQKAVFDLINLDPPAFVKSKNQLSQALKGYKEINLRALKLLKRGGILITSSCSHHLSLELFFEILREAALDAKRDLQLLHLGVQSPDHPMLLSFPESNYLKCLFLRVR